MPATRNPIATRTQHPSRASPPTAPRPQARPPAARILIPTDADTAALSLAGRDVRLTNLRKPFWPELGITKRDLLQYYADVAPALLPHLADRAMVMKRYPNGASGTWFFMKRAPQPRPAWIETCSIAHASGSVIDFPVVQDLASLLWLVNLGCIDLNPWYARCDDVDRPDYLHFDLDPVPGASFDDVRATALIVREALASLHMPAFVKTTGSKGLHVYVPIVRGPTQKYVWAWPSSSPSRWPSAIAASSPPSTGSRNVLAGMCLSITTRTPGDARSHRFIRRVPRRARPCRRR
jgi:bifunctional non-homologous end joining protein LigD